MADSFIFSSESVTAGHPDKLCDQISDAIVDHFLAGDPYSSIIAECAVSSGVLFVAAQFASKAKLDIPDVARKVIRGVGYPKGTFDADACTIMTSFSDQTATDYWPLDLQAMDESAIRRITAKNQVTAFGYACDQTPALMPLPIWLAHRLAERLGSSAVQETLPYLLPDGQSQVAVEYRGGKPHRIHSITLIASETEDAGVDTELLRESLIEHVVRPVFKLEPLQPDEKTQVFVNPEGPVIGGGPTVHSGLTGRKTGIDTYGQYARQSGAALSGKGPMRIDRVAAYVARFAAKNVVAAGLAAECEVSLSYSVGVSEPVSLRVRTFGSGNLDDGQITERLRSAIDFRIGGVVRDLRLQRLPAEHDGHFYQNVAVYGHMGRIDMDIPWEKTDTEASSALKA
jgi:S-adenosylmethionine synthetase